MPDHFLKAWCLIHSLGPHLLNSQNLKQATSDYQYCVRHGVHWLCLEDEHFPELLKSSTQTLKAFYYIGKPCWVDKISVSVVGSRNPSSLSVQWLEDHFTAFLNAQDVVVVSGGARGIDQRAHALALRAQTPTVAFLPSGLKSMYPYGFVKWSKAIIDGGGAVISGFPLGKVMYKSHFHLRNHWIAQMSVMTFMVEGRLKSGSLLTAKKAMSMGREVCALPQAPYSPAQGYMEVLGGGGTLVRDSLDLLAVFGRAEVKRPLF